MNDQTPGDANSGQPRIQRIARIPPERYVVLGILGSGGMGTILKARHVQLNKLVAIKVLNMELLRDQSSLSRFETEARAGGQLSHPNLVAVFDFGYSFDGEPYFVMEYIEGSGLSDMVKRFGRCSNADFIFIFAQALKALNYIHKNNIIHRDIKGSNIMLQFIEGDRYVKVLDFGIAKVLADSGVTMQQITATGEAVGSPLYMSPEQCRGSRIDGRSDLYSLGCVMHECFAGYPPFRGGNAMQTIHMHLHDPPSPLSSLCRSDQDLQIASMIHKCILKNPDDRFQTAAELAAHLEEIANIGARVQAIQRPAPPQQTAGANRWKKGKTSEQAVPPATGSGLHQALRPETPGGASESSGLSQTFRRSSQPAGQQLHLQGDLSGATNEHEIPREQLADRWHLHNVAGQQSMYGGNQFEAERHFIQAVEIAEQLGYNDERLPQSLSRLAYCLKNQGRYPEAERTYLKALQVHESIVGPTSKELLSILEHLSNLMRIMKREAEAEKIEKRMQAIMKSK